MDITGVNFSCSTGYFLWYIFHLLFVFLSSVVIFLVWGWGVCVYTTFMYSVNYWKTCMWFLIQGCYVWCSVTLYYMSFCEYTCAFLFGMYLEIELLGQRMSICSTLVNADKQFSKMVVLIYVLTNSSSGSPSSPTLCTFHLSHFSHSDGNVVTLHWI